MRYLKLRESKEQYFWDKQIERHRLGKKIRKMLRKEKYNPYAHLSRRLKVSRKTIWALANGLTIPSRNLIERIEELENK
jgi:transcriptional regulator with XRE-family HTH domain